MALSYENDRFPDSRFRCLDLSGTEFDDVNLSRVRFHNVNMADADFSDINLRNSRFSAIDIAGARFSCTSAGVGDRERIPLHFGANYHISNSTFDGCDLDGVTIRNSTLKRRTIENCDLSGMRINGIDVHEMMAAYKKAAIS